jgi:hypothetical protein
MCRDGGIEFGLATSGDENVGALGDEALGRREVEAAGSPVMRAILFLSFMIASAGKINGSRRKRDTSRPLSRKRRQTPGMPQEERCLSG